MSAQEELLRVLRARPNIPAAELRTALGVSRPTLMRLVRAAGPAVLTIGRGRRTAYAARRPLAADNSPLPIFRIDEKGRYDHVAQLHLACPHGSALEWTPTPCPWPLDESMRDGWSGGLPYFLQDLWPEGFLGRTFARAVAPILALDPDPKRWTEDQVLLAMSLYGSDPVGDLLVGEGALKQFLARLQKPDEPLKEPGLPARYAALAEQAMAGGHPGSSAAGEFPKFTAIRQQRDGPAKVLVKFSGSDGSEGSQRWSDLLVCEHLAAEVLNGLPGIDAAHTRILQARGRTFLESERFDRHGAHGRSAVCTWGAINHAWFGMSAPWPQGAARLRELKLIEPETEQAVEVLWHFGQLIGNNDMHDGNLSFRPGEVRGRPGFRLAPAYDMLPMLYAPARGVELPPVDFNPALPLPYDRPAWLVAARGAVAFWDRAAQDTRISGPFRRICAGNIRKVQGLMALVE